MGESSIKHFRSCRDSAAGTETVDVLRGMLNTVVQWYPSNAIVNVAYNIS